MRGAFTEEWFSDESCKALAGLYSFTEKLPGSVVEVGCWQGRSTIALAHACHPHTVHAVDTWEGSPGEISRVLASERDVYAEFQRNLHAAHATNVHAYRMGWREFFETHREKIRFIHIDATHSYEEVRDNIETVLPLIVPGGVICGDDAHHEPVRQAVLDTLGDAVVTASLWAWQKPEA